MPNVPLNQNSFATGEISPTLFGRTDLQKVHTACAMLRNFYVDARGGVTTRPGTQEIGGFGSAGRGRLIPFVFSPKVNQSYVLCFSPGKIRFIRNPQTPTYPNSSNAGFVLSAGIPYEVVTPYTADMIASMHYVQIADVMWLACHGAPRMKLSRIADANWTLTAVTPAMGLARPAIGGITITALPAGSTDPQKTRYMYAVSAVDANGNESLPSAPFVSGAGINISTTNGTVTVYWTPIAGAVFYKVYKALPTQGDTIPAPSEQLGFVGYSYGTTFTDSNIIAAFEHTPLRPNDPFAPSPIIGFNITNPGATYPIGATTLTVTDGTGTGAEIYPIFATNAAGGTGGIVGLYIANGGSGYTAPTISASGAGGSGFAATLSIGPSAGIEPDVVGIFQQRFVYASTDNKPHTLFVSRPGTSDDFRRSNPTVDNDAFEIALFLEKVSDIVWLKAMPGGLIIGTDAGVVQLSGGGGSESNPAAITATNNVALPQPTEAVADIAPIAINDNLLFVQTGGKALHDLKYNFFANTWAGDDLTILVPHLFELDSIAAMAWQNVPSKIMWCVMQSGRLCSLTYIKAQDVFGWARHDTTFGLYEDVCVLREGAQDAVYFAVNRSGTRHIERQASQVYRQISDAWQLDAAVSSTPTIPNVTLTLAALSGASVVVTASSAVFSAGDVGKKLYAGEGNATVIGFTDTTHITVNITSVFTTLILVPLSWELYSVTTAVNMSHLPVGTVVWALVDGEVQSGYTVPIGGIVNLTTFGFRVVMGIPYVSQFQPLYVDVGGETTIQGQPKKIYAGSIRVRNTKGLKIGTSTDDIKPWAENVTSKDVNPRWPRSAAGLFSGDQRITLEQFVSVGGWMFVQQDNPLPATILAAIPEVAL